jgi:hypothetical protein
MTRWAYFDTSALARWAEGDVASPSDRGRDGRTAVANLIADPDCALSLSEVTILEFSSTLNWYWRNSEYPQHDQAWAEKSLDALMGEIASGRIDVVPVPPKAGEHAMALMKVATRDRGIAFHTWDAFHLITATSWADQLGQKVELITSDSDFDRFVDAFPHFRRLVSVVNVV